MVSVILLSFGAKSTPPGYARHAVKKFRSVSLKWNKIHKMTWLQSWIKTQDNMTIPNSSTKWKLTWKDLDFWKSQEWKDLKVRLTEIQYFPKKTEIFKALLLTSLEDTRVVIIGQDPYPNPGHANGLAFSVSENWRAFLPPTLVNIFKELQADVGCRVPINGDLSPWARQGVLLLNTSLTVAPKLPGSHRDLGWRVLTTEIVRACVEANSNTVFVLWGNDAQGFLPMLGSNPRVLSVHPSPLSAHKGFFGSRPFTKVNALLQSGAQGVIEWRL